MVEKLYNEDADRYIFIDEDNAENLIELEKMGRGKLRRFN